MRFTDIVDAIKVCSPELRKTDIVDGLLHPIADGFKLRNQKGNKFDFLQSNRVSELLTSDKIPECLILTFKQPSFTKAITKVELLKDGRVDIYADMFGVKAEINAIDTSKSTVKLENRFSRHQ